MTGANNPFGASRGGEVEPRRRRRRPPSASGRSVEARWTVPAVSL